MPPAIPLIGILIGVAITSAIPGIIGTVLAAIVSIGLGFLSQALAPKPKAPDTSNLANSSRNIEIKQAIVPWQFAYGVVRKSGPLVFAESTDHNQKLHVVVVLAAHECSRIGAVFLDDYPIYDTMLDSDGVVASGKFYDNSDARGYIKIKKHLGQSGQVADPDLAADTSFGADAVGNGMCYVYVTFIYKLAYYSSSLPNVSAIVDGKLCYDPRDAVTRFTCNPVLFCRDYFATTFALGGMGVVSATGFDDTTNNASANVCDEFVSVADTTAITMTVTSVDLTNNCVLAGDDEVDDNGDDKDGGLLPFQIGDRVQVSSTGAVPTGLVAATDYYAVPLREKAIFLRQPGAGDQSVLGYALQFATTYANALARTVIDLTGAGSGTITVKKTAEPRYQGSGVLDLNRAPADIIDDMRSAFGGRVYFISGKWVFLAAAWSGPSISFSESDVIGTIKMDTKVSRRDRFNSVKGLYISPITNWQSGDYPQVDNDSYIAADNGYRIYKELDFPFTTRAHTCMRLAKIELERSRQEISVELPLTLGALRVQAGNTIYLNVNRFGWVNKIFEIVNWTLNTKEDNSGVPFLSVILSLRETAAANFDWNSGEEVVVDPAANTILPNPFFVQPPGVPVPIESIYITRDGAGVKTKVDLTWAASPDTFVVYYQVEFKLHTDSVWQIRPQVRSTAYSIEDITPGIYDFRVKAINQIGASSAYATTSSPFTVVGLLAPPAAPQNLTIGQAGGLAILRWTPTTEVDVRIGGRFLFRHSPALTGATWAGSTSIGDAVPGSHSLVALPLVPGTYLGRTFDSAGVQSLLVSTVITQGAQVLAFTPTGTLVEDPVFSGTKTNTIVTGLALTLGAAGLVDDIPDIDAMSSLIDSYGGVTTSGTYDFATVMDLGSVQRVRLQKTLEAIVFNTDDMIDSRAGLMDTWSDFDGADSGDADCVIWVQETDDDPSGAPTWSDWQRLDSSEYNARAFKAQARLSSIDTTYNIAVSQLRLTASTSP